MRVFDKSQRSRAFGVFALAIMSGATFGLRQGSYLPGLSVFSALWAIIGAIELYTEKS